MLNDTLDEEEREVMSRHRLFGRRDQRLELDDEVHAIDRPRPDLDSEPITSFSGYKGTLFDENGRAPKELPPLRMGWGDGLGGKFYFSESGTEYTNYGRGPTWGGWTAHGRTIPARPDLNPDQNVDGSYVQANSSGIDCLIVAGMFLDVGQTTADRGSDSRSNWLKKLTPIQKEYLDAVRTDWNDYARTGSVKKKKRFYDAVLRSLNFEYREFTPPAGVWVGPLATNFHQFTFHVATRKACARCRFTSIDGDPGGQHALSVDVDFDMVQKNPNITLSHYLRYYFGHRASQDKKVMSREFHCGVPPSKARKIVIGGMPPRLVVTPETRKDATIPIPEHTNRDISFHYEDETGDERSAIYRWIGGIYLSNQHYRVYWDDGEFHDELIKVYDGQQPFSAGTPARAGLFGTIIGGLEPPTAGERVPFPWNDAPCLLFYERVDNTPGIDQLNAIQSIAEKLKEAVAVDLTAELEIGGKSLQNLWPIGAQIHNLKSIQTNDYVKKIALLEQRKSCMRAARDAQEADTLREKEEARQVVMKELEMERNTRPIPPPPLKYSRSRLPQRTSTSLLHTLLSQYPAPILDTTSAPFMMRQVFGKLSSVGKHARDDDGNAQREANTVQKEAQDDASIAAGKKIKLAVGRNQDPSTRLAAQAAAAKAAIKGAEERRRERGLKLEKEKQKQKGDAMEIEKQEKGTEFEIE
ncbi:MAG: hypothetical protein M1813_009258 [Trichoglossum hirsutum]|nr:MAG: hypothetical protein M1813_009258 [Trichoglossum hirsutum]